MLIQSKSLHGKVMSQKDINIDVPDGILVDIVDIVSEGNKKEENNGTQKTRNNRLLIVSIVMIVAVGMFIFGYYEGIPSNLFEKTIK